MIVGLTKLNCEKCNKPRLHETMFDLGKCVICHSQRSYVPAPIEVERFVD